MAQISWSDFKALVDNRMEEIDIETKLVTIEYIDINGWDGDDIEIELYEDGTMAITT